jgi:hydroxylamine reductase (hybrid-cluster protein)
MEFQEVNGVTIAKEIIKVAIDNYTNRKHKVCIPDVRSDMVAGFSHELPVRVDELRFLLLSRGPAFARLR